MNALRTERRDDVMVIWIDRPGERVNTLDAAVLDEFRAALDEVEGDASLAGAVVASAKRDSFVVGADIRQFGDFGTKDEVIALIREGHALLDRLERFPRPVVAAVHGACVGGGLELVMACAYRIASEHPSTRFALPEVNLGLLPGLGGTQRLPRLAGLQKGLELILTGRNVYARPARKAGIVDAVHHPQGLVDAGVRAARELAAGRLERRGRSEGILERLLERTPASALVYNRAAESVEKRARGNYPAPPRILEVVRTGMERGMRAGLEAEARAFADLVFTPESRALRHVFLAQTAAKRGPDPGGATEVGGVGTIGVIGAGLMGSGIAEVSARDGMDVLLKDVDLARAAAGKKAVWKGVSRSVGKGVSEFERDRIVERVVPVEGWEPFSEADLTIEAVLEDLELKRAVLADVEAATNERHVFASNTSAIPIARIAEGAARPERVLGMHYFSPVPKMPLLEIIRHEGTSDEAVATAFEIGRRQGKTVIVVADRPGFYVNRVLIPYMAEALHLLREGADVRAVDDAMTAWGFPVGPLKLIDETGFDVGAKVIGVMAPPFRERGVELAAIDPAVLAAGYRGRKSGKGFYVYDEDAKGKGKSREVNRDVYRFFGGAERRTVARNEIQERLSLALLNEAVFALEEGVIASPRDGDLGAVFGIGFPPFRGGPFHMLDAVGPGRVLEALRKLEGRHGARFSPAPMLVEVAERGGRFHAGEGEG